MDFLIQEIATAIDRTQMNFKYFQMTYHCSTARNASPLATDDVVTLWMPCHGIQPPLSILVVGVQAQYGGYWHL